MKYIYIICLIVSIVFSSCRKSSEIFYDNGFGSLSINIDISESTSPRSTYASSTARPISTWMNNIKDMLLILYDGSNIIQYVSTITPPSIGDNSTQIIVLTNVPVGIYTAIIVTNSNQTSNISTVGYEKGWNSATLVGKNKDELVLGLVPSTSYQKAVGEGLFSAYRYPEEVFVASKSNVSIIKDSITTITNFSLTRLISLLRIRIDKSGNGNRVVDFGNSNADLRIMNSAITYNLTLGVDTTPTYSDLVYDIGYNLTNPTSGYSSGSILNASGMSAWNDVAMFPCKPSSITVILGGMAPKGYIPYGSKKGLASPAMVYWDGKVQVDIGSNNILEVNCTLVNKGATSLSSIVGSSMVLIKN